MSKSIYDEALDIVMESLEQPDNSVIFKHAALNVLKRVIEKAQKQEKLLELYKEKDKLKDFFAMGSIRAEKYKKIEKQIKEVENGNEE